MSIDAARLRSYFLDLVRIDSLSRCEGAIAKRLVADLEAIGATVEFDDAAAAVGGEVGNLIAHVPGTVDAPAMLLCAHMDTVEPGIGVTPIVEGDIIRSDGTTVLGGDDKSGVAIVMECARVCRESERRYPPIEIVFTICEEVGLLGARNLDLGRVHAMRGFVFDSDAAGFVFTRAPGATHFEVTITGRAAHAGMAPEQGVSAIHVAATAIADMTLGRVDDETTANVGTIAGGRAVNIIPEQVRMRGEARSHDPAKLEAQLAHMRGRFEDAAHAAGATAIFTLEPAYQPMHVSDDAAIMHLLRDAASSIGRPITSAGMGGGCDANVLNGRGLEVVNIGTGMQDIHTTKEWLRVSDMVAAAEVTLAAVTLAADRP